MKQAYVTQAVVWVNKKGNPVCTVTETVVAKPHTTTTTHTTKSTTTIIVEPIPATPKPKPAPKKHVEPAKTPEKPTPPPPQEKEECYECHEAPKPAPVPVVIKPKPTHPQNNAQYGGGGTHHYYSDVGTTHGISYAAYRSDHACKTQADIDDDFAQMKGQYSIVRTYGTDCYQVPYIYLAAKRIGCKVMFGIWDINDVQNEAQLIISGVKGDWGMVHSISVGNELVNNGEASADQVVAAVRQTRQILRRAGYDGPVVAVDTFIAAGENPQLCEESDYCAINAHAFFDSTISAEEAGPWLERTVDDMRGRISSEKQIIVTETGWPTRGPSNGLAVPSMANQKLALESISKSFADKPSNVILFSAFNDLWKGERDKYWGIGGAISRCDK